MVQNKQMPDIRLDLYQLVQFFLLEIPSGKDSKQTLSRFQKILHNQESSLTSSHSPNFLASRGLSQIS